MKASNTFIELFTILLLITLIGLLFHYLKWYLASTFTLVYFLILYILKYKILKLTPLRSSDKLLLGDDYFNRQFLVLYMELENFNVFKVKSKIEEAFEKVPKLRKSLVYTLQNFYWKQVKPLNDVIKTRIKVLSPMDRQELDSFIKFKTEENINCFEDPIEFHLIPLLNSQNGVLLVKSDHIFSDGMGIFSLFACLSDNYSMDLFPPFFHTRRSQSFINSLLYYVLFVFLCIPVLLYNVIFTKSQTKLMKKERTTKNTFSKRYQYDLKSIKQLTKTNHISINDLFLGHILSSIKRMKTDSKKITVMIPIGQTDLPDSLESIQLENRVSGIIVRLNLLDDVLLDADIMKKNVNTIRKHLPLVKILDHTVYLFSLILPFNIFYSIASRVYKEIDLTVTNVPTMTMPIYLGGQKVVDIDGYTSTGYIENLFIIMSYDSKIGIRGVVDSNMMSEFNINEYFNVFDETMRALLMK